MAEVLDERNTTQVVAVPHPPYVTSCSPWDPDPIQIHHTHRTTSTFSSNAAYLDKM